MVRYQYSREEEVLIIDLYTRLPTSRIKDNEPEIIELCNLLKSCGYGCSASGIRNKMENLKSVDPEYVQDGRIGRNHISKSFMQMWNDFSKDGFVKLDDEVEKSETTIRNHIANNPNIPTKIGRDGQSSFRQRVLATYESKCLISGISQPSIIQACHIKPYKECVKEKQMEQAMDVRNGICLNVLYHVAFDKGLISFDEDMHLMLSPDFKRDSDDKFFSPYENKKFELPERVLEGTQFYLKYHRDNIFSKGIV